MSHSGRFHQPAERADHEDLKNIFRFRVFLRGHTGGRAENYNQRSYDHFVGRFTTPDQWETDTRWSMYGADGFLSHVSLGDIQPTELMEVRRPGVTVPAFTLTYKAALAKRQPRHQLYDRFR